MKRRWDDDLIFKNQAAGVDDKPKKGEFVNDLLRSEFHKKFMLKSVDVYPGGSQSKLMEVTGSSSDPLAKRMMSLLYC